MAKMATTRSLLTASVVGLTLSVATAEFTTPIEHVVLLMFENRAFDHMLGFYPGVNGLKGNETNPVNVSNPNGPFVTVQKESPYIGPFDPDHGTEATTFKIFGEKCIDEQCVDPKMDGFINFAANKHGLDQAKSLMNMFTPDRVPVMSALADNFAVFDRFFCSHPGPTWPNRLFQLMATSHGDTKTSQWDNNTINPLYPGRTVFDVVEEAGHDWKFYFNDAPLEMAMIRKVAEHPLKVKGWKDFKRDIAEGKLPAFSWVNPQWFVNTTSGLGASDQHPDHDVRLGEALMKEVYEDLRSSPKWNNTLFLITYDEHGGFYDHVPPPMGVPAPDDSKSFPDEFDFKRLGVRIPVLMISPWVSKGTVISAPLESEKPASNSEFDLTSVIATVKKLFNAPKFITKRDAWAATFEGRLNETSPRTDCPMTLPPAPKTLGTEHAEAEAKLLLNDLQVDIVNAFAALDGQLGSAELPTRQGDVHAWITKIVDKKLNDHGNN